MYEKRLKAWRHKYITRTNTDLSSEGDLTIDTSAISK